MNLAVVGAGVSGLVVARRLAARHRVTIFESSSRLGGHVNTVEVDLDGARLDVDTGFIVYNEEMYPRFTALLAELGIESRETTMGFGVRCDRTGLEYSGESAAGLFADPRNLARPAFWRMLLDIARFRREAVPLLESAPPERTVDEFLAASKYGPLFASHFLAPLGAALWSCPTRRFRAFPIEFVIRFLDNHAMLAPRSAAAWRTIPGGARRYVEKLARPFVGRVRFDCAAERIVRGGDGVTVAWAGGEERFDEVVLACHPDQALEILADTDLREREILGAFPYQENEAVLHFDDSVLARRPRARASWNARLPADDPEAAFITYDLTRLQGLSTKRTICLTLNDPEAIDPAKVIRRMRYEHPTYSPRRLAMQARHGELIRARRTSYCGAYWGFGFHEDGVASAERVAEAFA